MYGAVCISQNHCLKKLYLIMISSTSLPGGNQVDGLPPVSSRKRFLMIEIDQISNLTDSRTSPLGDEGFENKKPAHSRSGLAVPVPGTFLLFGWRLEAGGKPSTWFPPGGLVELITKANESVHKVFLN